MEKTCCSCEKGNCLSKTCPCLLKGLHCNENCKCKECKNNLKNDLERTLEIEKILYENPMVFTSGESLNQDEFSAFSNFAKLIHSVDTEGFRLKEKLDNESKSFQIKILWHAIRTIFSAANESFKSSQNIGFEESLENSMFNEFQYILELMNQRSKD